MTSSIVWGSLGWTSLAAGLVLAGCGGSTGAAPTTLADGAMPSDISPLGDSTGDATSDAGIDGTGTILDVGGTVTDGADDAGDASFGDGSGVDSSGGEGGGGTSSDATFDGIVSDATLDPETACAATSYGATLIPPNVLVVLDRSLSMNQKPDGTTTKWNGAAQALMTLLAAADDSQKWGLELFPYPTDSCTTLDPVVDVAPLSTTRTPIDCWTGAAIGATCGTVTADPPSGKGGTPMVPALTGAIAYLKTTYTAPGPRAIVLITDGDPSGCGDIDQVITTAATGPATPAPAVPIFVIGVPGSTVANLSRVAFAGGGKRTDTCVANTSDATMACNYTIDGTSSFETELIAALEDITGKVKSCDFAVPAADPGKTVDPSLVNVDVSSATLTGILPQDPTHTSGWDYTDSSETTIEIYGSACAAVQADPSSTVEILLGCATDADAATPDAPATDAACIAVGDDCGHGGSCCAGLSCVPDTSGNFNCAVAVH